MGGSEASGNGTGTVLDALLKFITLEKLGVSIADIAAAGQEVPAPAPAAEAAAPVAEAPKA